MITKTVLDALQEQLMLELATSQMYLSMATWCDHENLPPPSTECWAVMVGPVVDGDDILDMRNPSKTENVWNVLKAGKRFSAACTEYAEL